MKGLWTKLERMCIQILIMLGTFQCISASASKVKLKDNGYENLVIAINPQLQENLQIIKNIKEMVTEASMYLFNATYRRFYYREVKILIPSTWQSLDNQKPKQEAYEKANVIVSNQNFNYGNEPYTLHYKGCGKEGQCIHFSPEFLSNDDLISVYGSRGRVFVHEWAHYRWGVFDEYNYENPFFVSVENKIKATRCSSEISGMYICKKRSCSNGDCIVDPETGNLEAGCMFLVNNTQKVKSSIMYMQALSSVVEFCNKDNHDREAPNKQNKMCSYQSTWEVIMSSSDYRSTLPMRGNKLPPPPTFVLLQPRVRTICLVLEASENMATGERIRRLQQAAAIFLMHIVETGSHIGIVTYNETAVIRSPLHQIINDDERRNLTSYLPITSNGGTNICKGILSGLEVLRSLDGNADGSEIIVVASGKDRDLYRCVSDVSLSGSVIHTIAMGPDADADLEHFSELTGGYSFFASDSMESNSLIDAFSQISSANGNLLQHFIKLESISKLTRRELTGPVIIDSTLGNDTVFIITWQAPELPYVIIQDPNGKNYTKEDFEYDIVSQVAYLRVPGVAQEGIWKYNIINTFNFSQILSILVISRPVSETNPPVTVTVDIDKNVVYFPSPIIVSVGVNQGIAAVLGVNVTAIIEYEVGILDILTLDNDGAGADVSKDDGIYSKYLFSFPQNGRYTLKINVEWENTATLITLQNSQAMYVAGYIENGTINMNPPRPLISEFESTIQSFMRTTTTGSFIVTNVSNHTFADIFPPCRIIDLQAKMENGYVCLSWTSPGDNYDQGIASSYEIRISANPVELRENFFSAALINTSTLQPQNAGSRETFTFLPHDITNENGSITYIAIRTRDKASLQSEISNLVHVVRHMQSENLDFIHSTDIVKNDITTVIVIVLSLVSVCLVLAASIYALKKNHSIISDMDIKDKFIEETQDITECQEQAFPLKILPKNNFSEKSIMDLENQTEV